MTNGFQFGALAVQRLRVGPLEENCYCLCMPDGAGVLVDPGDDAGKILAWLKTLKAKPSDILLTHAHFDHVGAVEALRQALGIPVWLHKDALEQFRNAATSAARWGIHIEQPSDPDQFLEAGALRFGLLELKALFTPGHAPGHVAFAAPGFVISGDALFKQSIGRTDFPGCDQALLLEHIRTGLLVLPDETLVFPGHGGHTSIGFERLHNPYLQGA